MSAARLIEYLSQMRSAAQQACEFVADMDQEGFMRDAKTQMAVAMALVLVGESASRIMTRHPEFSVDHPEIPWARIRGMRNMVAHEYYELELPLVLETVRTSLPQLLSALDALQHWRAQGE
jgi:uncharacterized protein with HEPN domain